MVRTRSEGDIFGKAPDGEPITWCSQMFVQPKYAEIKNEALEPQITIASVDMRIPNEAMKGSRCVHAQRVDDFIHRLHD